MLCFRKHSRVEFSMKEKPIIIRYLIFALGMAINSFGISFITKSALGTSQISSVPYVLSLKFSFFSFGVWSFLVNMLFILGQIVLLKREFKPIQFLQIPVNILFSWLIDVCMFFLGWLQPETFLVKLICLLIGCLILALGVTIEISPNVITVPGEGIVRAISIAVNRHSPDIRFGSIKVIFDVSLIVLAAILSFLFFGSLKGVGLGTVISALLVGRFVNLFSRWIR